MYKKGIGRPGLILTAVAAAQFMAALDISIVNVALPAIRADLGFGAARLQWVVHAYTLAFGGLLLLGGRMSDLYGRRGLLCAGLGLFGLSSLAGGLAQSADLLVAARAVQGLAAAALVPAALATLTTTFPEGPGRTRALGVWSAVNAAGGATGVLAGGLLTDHVGWRWVMLVNVPVVVAALALTVASVPADRRRAQGERPDLLGAFLGTCGVTLLVLGVVRASEEGWTSAVTLGTLAAAVALLAVFVLVETARSRGPRTPMIRLGLLRNRSIAGANLFIFLAGAGMFAAFYFVSLYMQGVLRMSATATGLAFLPFTFGTVVGTVIATGVSARHAPRALLIPGGVLAAIGFGWFSLIDPSGNFAVDVLGPSLVTSVGLGMCFAPLAAAGTAGVAPHEAGMASGLLNSSRQLGGSVGLAALTTVAAGRTGTGTTPAAVTSGYSLGLAVSGVLLAAAVAVAVTVLPRRGRTVRPAPETPPETPPEAPLEATNPLRATAPPEAVATAGTHE
ncbi:MFS transporter [Streptosporangium jomthongense]|uniref:MFS transporter n=1 Tax=Streptosporangium jomthongense TaxID=1193683 RepID=A0ABV8F7C1_9ACTN